MRVRASVQITCAGRAVAGIAAPSSKSSSRICVGPGCARLRNRGRGGTGECETRTRMHVGITARAAAAAAAAAELVTHHTSISAPRSASSSAQPRALQQPRDSANASTNHSPNHQSRRPNHTRPQQGDRCWPPSTCEWLKRSASSRFSRSVTN